MRTRLIAPAVALALLAAGCSSGDASPSSGAGGAGKPGASAESVLAPDVVGKTLDDATSDLRAAGFTDITSEDVRDGKSIWDESNWSVVDQRTNGDSVWLGVEKPGDWSGVDTSADTTPATEEALDLDAEDLRYVKVLALQTTLVNSPDQQALCDGYAAMGAELTAAAINQEVALENQFPADVVREVFDANC